MRTRTTLAAGLLAGLAQPAPTPSAGNLVVSKDMPLREVAHSCFDNAAFPTQVNAKLELIQRKHPQKIVWPEPDPAGAVGRKVEAVRWPGKPLTRWEWSTP